MATRQPRRMRKSAAVEDYLDGREIVRRIADPANYPLLTLSELKARREL